MITATAEHSRTTHRGPRATVGLNFAPAVITNIRMGRMLVRTPARPARGEEKTEAKAVTDIEASRSTSPLNRERVS